MLNKVFLIGRLGNDPEVRTLNNGVKVATFRLATSENYKDKGGNWKESTEWHSMVAWRFIAERVEKLKKGDLIHIEGKNQSREYIDRQEIKRRVTEVVINGIKKLSFVGNGQNTNQSQAYNHEPLTTTQGTDTSQVFDDNDSDPADDLPF